MLFPFEKIRVKPGTVLIETVLSVDSRKYSREYLVTRAGDLKHANVI